MNPEQLSETIVDALAALVADGAITLPDGVPAQVTVERPRQQGHGDYATNVALQLAKKAGTNPRAFAELLAERLRAADGIAEVEVAGPGFLNITRRGRGPGPGRGRHRRGRGGVRPHRRRWPARRSTSSSSRPTRPARCTSGTPGGPSLGDAIARVLEAAGAEVAREYYINDRGNQMDLFGASLEAARARPARSRRTATRAPTSPTWPQQIVAEHAGHPRPARGRAARRPSARRATRCSCTEQQDQLDGFRTHFDVWFSERDACTTSGDGRWPTRLEQLRGQGHLFEADGALWMRTTDFGDDKDRVLIRTNGEPTYFASDTAYYLNKRERGFDRCIYLLGADHHGYVGRLKAMAACAGDDPERNIEVLIGQLVKIMRDGEEVRLSKRAGTIVTLDELVDEIGVDALRYSLARYPADCR